MVKRLVRPLLVEQVFFSFGQMTNWLIRPYSRSKVVFINVSKNQKKNLRFAHQFGQVGESGRFRPLLLSVNSSKRISFAALSDVTKSLLPCA